MCKRSFSDFAARPNNKRKAAGGSKVPVSESTRHAPKELTIREMLAAGGDLEQITSSFCGLTNAVHPIFAEGNICVCRHENGEYCYRPELIAELDSATNKIEGLLEPTWNPTLESVVLRSALQLATRFITHEDTLPFWAGLLDCARNQATDVPRPFRVRARKHLSTEKANSVLESLSTEVASRIRILFRSFALIPEEFSLHDVDGFCTPFEICDEDPNFDPAWSEIFNYAWRDGKPAMEADAFPHIFMNVDEPVGCNTSSDDWLDCTVSEVKASIVGFASTIGHEFAHAVAVITQNGGPPPRLNDEAVIETGCSWEQFVFGGKLSFHDDDGQLYVMPWPNYEIWKVYAAHDDDLELRAIGGGALPLARIYRAERQKWERFLEQRFWEETRSAEKTFKKLSLNGQNAVYSKKHYFAREKVCAPPKGRRVCLGEEENQRQRIEAIRARGDEAMAGRPDRWDRVVDRAEERRNSFHESEGKPMLDEFWAQCTKHVGEDVFL